MNDNLLTKLIDKKLGIKLKFQTAPQDGAKQKQSLLLASGNYPAAFIGGDFSKVNQQKYSQQGILIPLNSLIKQYAPNIQKVFKEYPWLKKGITTPNGNIYTLPGYSGCDHCMYPAKLWLNQKWLKKLNLKMPTTTAQFEQVMKAFKNNDPNGNHKKDEIPLSGSSDSMWRNPVYFLMNAFIYTDPSAHYLRIHNGKVDLVADDAAWKQGLEYIHKLYTEGLIDPQSFTQKISGLQQEAMNPKNIILGAYANLWNGNVVTIYGKDPDQRWNQYYAVPPLKGPNGVQWATDTQAMVPDGEFAITNKATKQQQIAAIKVANYLYSQEGAINSFQGVTNWTHPKTGHGIDGGKPVFKTKPSGMNWNAPSNALWNNGFYFMSTKLYLGQAVSQNTMVQAGNETRLYQENEKYKGHQPPVSEQLPNLYIAPSKVQTVSQLQTTIKNYIKENTVAFIMGKKDINKDWNNYVNGFNKLNSKEYLSIYQNAYDKNQKK